jgi:hypothetical protein
VPVLGDPSTYLNTCMNRLGCGPASLLQWPELAGDVLKLIQLLIKSKVFIK